MINGQWKTQTRPRRRSGLPALILSGIWLGFGGILPARAQDDFERCKSISGDQARLECLKSLLQAPRNGSGSEDHASEDLWPLVKTPRPGGAGNAIAVTRTAETGQSDPDLAGLMIRCQEKSKPEVLLALVRPVPPRSKRDVTVSLGSAESVLHAEALPTGMALILPVDPTIFTSGPWHDLKQLTVKISDPEGNIRGTISLEGVAEALTKLAASCR